MAKGLTSRQADILQYIVECIRESCGPSLSEALKVQAKHSAGFMNSRLCQKGMIGSECAKIMNV